MCYEECVTRCVSMCCAWRQLSAPGRSALLLKLLRPGHRATSQTVRSAVHVLSWHLNTSLRHLRRAAASKDGQRKPRGARCSGAAQRRERQQPPVQGRLW